MARVSLIMTTFNSREYFVSSMESALSQDYPDLEIVVKDGNSTDGTVDSIRRYEGICKERGIHYLWKSGSDLGIYDGMNQGIQMATGDIIAVFNDLFTRNDAISLLVSAISSGDYIGAHADLAYMDGDTLVRSWRMGEGKIRDGWMPAHPTLYLKKSVYDTYGLYDLTLRSSSDYEFMVRVLKDPSNRLAYVPIELIHMFYGGTSNGGIKGYLRNIREAYMALHKNHMPFPSYIIFRRILRTLRQFRL